MAPFVSFDEQLRARIVNHLARHDRRRHSLDGRKHAAVAVVLVDSDAETDGGDPHVLAEGWDAHDVPGDEHGFDGRMVDVAGGAAFVLCRRAARLSTHSAQWALPGGRVDHGETPTEAALRETEEELGLTIDPSAVLGLLDDYPTRSGYVITPVVVWGGAAPTIVPSPDEVTAAYRVGLHSLRAHPPRYIAIPESDRPVLQIPISQCLIHAPTGAVLLQFMHVALDGNLDERVDHLEQPVFAWR